MKNGGLIALAVSCHIARFVVWVGHAFISQFSVSNRRVLLTANSTNNQQSIFVLATRKKAANLMDAAALDHEVRTIEDELRSERHEYGEFE